MNYPRARWRLLVFAGALLSAGAFSADKVAHKIHLRGSTTLQPMAQHVAEQYMLEHAGAIVVVSGGGSHYGHKGIVDGTTDIAMFSATPSEEQQKQLQQRNIKLVKRTVGYAAMVAVVHPANPVKNLSLVQLKDIFTGRITDWKEVGGGNAPIKVLIGAPTSGVTDAFSEAVIGDHGNFTAKGLVMRDRDRMNALAGNPAAISFLASGSVDRRFRDLKIDGIDAGYDNVLSGRYALRTPLVLAYRESDSAALAGFVRYFVSPAQQRRYPGIVPVESGK